MKIFAVYAEEVRCPPLRKSKEHLLFKSTMGCSTPVGAPYLKLQKKMREPAFLPILHTSLPTPATHAVGAHVSCQHAGIYARTL